MNGDARPAVLSTRRGVLGPGSQNAAGLDQGWPSADGHAQVHTARVCTSSRAIRRRARRARSATFASDFRHLRFSGHLSATFCIAATQVHTCCTHEVDDVDADRSVSGQDGWFPPSDVRIWLISLLPLPMPPVYRDVYRASFQSNCKIAQRRSSKHSDSRVLMMKALLSTRAHTTTGCT